MDKYFPTQQLKVFTDKDFSDKDIKGTYFILFYSKNSESSLLLPIWNKLAKNVHNTLGMCNLDTELEIAKKLEMKNPFILFFQDGKINGIFNGHKTYSCLKHFILSKEGMKEFL